MDEDWALDEPEIRTKTGTLTHTGKEMLTNLGRDGLLLLLANAKRLWKPLATHIGQRLRSGKTCNTSQE
jgi:hypothetical protein